MRNVWNSLIVCNSEGKSIWDKQDSFRLSLGLKRSLHNRDSSTPDRGVLTGSGLTISIYRAITLSDVRIERIASIRTAIANGSYYVSSANLAQKLMSRIQGNL